MRISAKDIPQADNLSDVLVLVRAVAEGATTYQEMAEAIDKVDRQGRYYRRAAEILGLIRRSGPNTCQLTDRGRELAASASDQVSGLVAASVLSSRLCQRIIPFLESHGQAGCTRSELETFIKGVTAETGPSMIPRRTSTIVSWLSAAQLLTAEGDQFVLMPPKPGSPVVPYSDTEPLLPSGFLLNDYYAPAQRASSNKGVATYGVDQARLERANEAHQRLVNLVADKIRACGAVPRSNAFVDLAATVRGEQYIFEMKSVTGDNARDQVRTGVAQLHEYRYLQAAKDASLVLVIEYPLPAGLAWMADYLADDRKIGLVWDGDGERLYADPRQGANLDFLR